MLKGMGIMHYEGGKEWLFRAWVCATISWPKWRRSRRTARRREMKQQRAMRCDARHESQRPSRQGTSTGTTRRFANKDRTETAEPTNSCVVICRFLPHSTTLGSAWAQIYRINKRGHYCNKNIYFIHLVYYKLTLHKCTFSFLMLYNIL